ncbi:plasmid mobilization protein [Nostoc sp. FACHB-892]|uniref:plasmid mobilization protein n=1 Tax=Nostoc sp. FACHB-892 TaxID=2692843 RepID=UPI001F54C303|nr:plasmid mobilization relaxosome protein MobC [Nostoc sp. FACHB-892]
MLNNLTITATLKRIILLKTATLNYFFVLRLRRTIILCGSFAESENFHIAATLFLSPLWWLRRTRIYFLLDLIQIPAAPLIYPSVGCRIVSSTATPKVLSPSAPSCLLRTHVALDTSPTPVFGLEASHASKLTLCLAALERQTGSSGEAPLEKPPSQCPSISRLMANRKQSKALVRKHIFPVRLSDIELDMIRIKSLDAGMSASELMRRNALMRPLPKRLSKISLQTYWELGQIGNNLNQLVKATNTALLVGRTLPADPELLRKLLELLHQCRRDIASDDIQDEDSEEEDEEDDWEAD